MNECQSNVEPFNQCCCQCVYHKPVFFHCCTDPKPDPMPEVSTEIEPITGMKPVRVCVCSIQKGWACVPPEENPQDERIHDNWSEHSCGCELHTTKADLEKWAKVEGMSFNEYQGKARSTAVYPSIGNNIVYPTLGLCGEAGEFAEKVKKAIRDDGGLITPERKENMLKELGDVLWYAAAIATELGVTLNDVAQANIDKLESRKQRDVLKGSGDNR